MCEISGHIEINISNCTFNYYDAPWPEFKDPYANDRKGGKGGRGGKDGNGGKGGKGGKSGKGSKGNNAKRG